MRWWANSISKLLICHRISEALLIWVFTDVYWLLLYTLQLYSAMSVDFLFPFGEDVGDSLLQRGNDRAANVQLSKFFPFFDTAESNVYVCQALFKTLH